MILKALNIIKKFFLLTIYWAISFVTYISKGNLKLIDRKLKIGAFVLYLLSSNQAKTQNFPPHYRGTCYYSLNPNKSYLKISKRHPIIDFGVSNNININNWDIYNKTGYRIGYNQGIINAGVDIQHYVTNSFNKYALGGYARAIYTFHHHKIKQIGEIDTTKHIRTKRGFFNYAVFSEINYHYYSDTISRNPVIYNELGETSLGTGVIIYHNKIGIGLEMSLYYNLYNTEGILLNEKKGFSPVIRLHYYIGRS